MRNSTPKASAFSKLYCSLFGHRYEVSKDVTEHIKEYTCACCKKELTTNGNGKLTELTPKFKEINSILENIYAKRAIAKQKLKDAETVRYAS